MASTSTARIDTTDLPTHRYDDVCEHPAIPTAPPHCILCNASLSGERGDGEVCESCEDFLIDKYGQNAIH